MHVQYIISIHVCTPDTNMITEYKGSERVYFSDIKCKIKQDRIKTAIQLTMCTDCLIEGALFLFLISVVLISYLVLYSVSKEDVMSGLTANSRVPQWSGFLYCGSNEWSLLCRPWLHMTSPAFTGSVHIWNMFV